MANYCIVDNTGTVINVINWDGVQDYTPPEGCIVVQTDTAGAGWTYINGAFTPPPEPTPVVTS